MTYPWGDTRRFNSYAGYFRRLFGCRVQKLSVDAGFTCPNRDGTIGEGGCTFCNNGAFTPSYCMPSKSVGQQIAEGIEFHRNRYRSAQRYLVYFQAFSNTYAPLERLKRLYDEALAHPGVAGIVVGTRPDCVDERKLDYFAGLARDRYVALEYGIESTFDATLRAVNRGHDFACARRAVEMTAARGLHVGAHFILGLPGETDAMLLDQVEQLVPSINTDGDNTTRFVVLSKEKPTAGNRFSLLFTVDNKPGKLAEVIQIIGASGYDMESIKSRPLPHVPFDYYFYVELVGDPTADETAALLRELDHTCRTVRLLGVYTK